MNELLEQEIILLLLRRKLHVKPDILRTSEISALLGISQQSASRNMISLEKRGFITRKDSRTSATQKSIDFARKMMRDAMLALSDSSIAFIGKLSETRKFIISKESSKVFAKRLFKPFETELSVFIREEDITKRLELRQKKPIVIGKMSAYKCRIGGLPAAILFRENSKDGLRSLVIVSQDDLCKKLSLKTGSEMIIEVV